MVNTVDNCVYLSNAAQTDSTLGFSISTGDQCDTDIDGDGVVNTVDNCVYLINAAQTD